MYSKNTHPQCKFPARFQWLQGKLNFKSQQVPKVKCPALDFWLSIIDYDSLSIVFSSYYLNAPASTFGHTFLKLNSLRFKANALLSYAIDYAAIIGDNIDFARYAIYGLFGGFEGHFSVLPYHLKVKSYNDMENRDLWEYRLNLKKEEIDRMVLHVYEMEQGSFDYYFIRENCGYHILSLLEIARPELDLRSHYKWVTFPSETLKLLAKNNIIEEIAYRPSSKVEIGQRIRKLEPQEKEIFFSLIQRNITLSETEFSQLSPQRKIYALDSVLAVLRSEVEYAAKKNRKSERKERHYKYLLEQRIKMPATEEIFQAKQEILPPHLSHAPFAIDLLGGTSSYGAFGALRVRPLLHEILNIEDGYPSNSDLLVFNTDLRWYEKEKSFDLYSLEIIKIASLVPYDSYSKSLSYSHSIRIHTEFLKMENTQTPDSAKKKNDIEPSNVFELEALLGYSYAPSSNGTVFSLLGGAIYRYSYERLQNKNSASPALSAIFLSKRARARGQILLNYYPFSLFFPEREEDEFQLKLAMRYSLAKDIEVFLELGQRKNYQEAAFRLQIHL